MTKNDRGGKVNAEERDKLRLGRLLKSCSSKSRRRSTDTGGKYTILRRSFQWAVYGVQHSLRLGFSTFAWTRWFHYDPYWSDLASATLPSIMTRLPCVYIVFRWNRYGMGCSCSVREFNTSSVRRIVCACRCVLHRMPRLCETTATATQMRFSANDHSHLSVVCSETRITTALANANSNPIKTTQLCSHTVVQSHSCAVTQLCSHTVVQSHSCAVTQLCSAFR